jgi:8-oxo-dGTP diphosphatase
VKRIEVVAALISDDQGRYLAQQRPAHKARGLLWEFPGGKVEAGESDAQALVREGREELGVELEVDTQVWSTVHDYPDLRVELRLHRARILQGEPRPLDAHAIRFLTPVEMQAMPFCEADYPLLAALAQGKVR